MDCSPLQSLVSSLLSTDQAEVFFVAFYVERQRLNPRRYLNILGSSTISMWHLGYIGIGSEPASYGGHVICDPRQHFLLETLDHPRKTSESREAVYIWRVSVAHTLKSVIDTISGCFQAELANPTAIPPTKFSLYKHHLAINTPTK